MPESEVLATIRVQVGPDNLTRSCRSQGCRGSLEKIPDQRVLVHVDNAFEAHRIEGKRCDYLLFFCKVDDDSLVAVPIELKGGSVDASDVREQLQGGADFINSLALQGAKALCRPVLIHQRSLHPKERNELNRHKIRFQGRPRTIRTAGCNRPRNLATALEL